MTALPAASEFTGSTVTEAQFKTAIANLRDYLNGLLGADGVTLTALNTLGALASKVSAKTGAYTVLAADRGTVFHCSGTWTLTLTAAATLATGHSFAVINTGSGTITIDPNASELIDNAATKALTAGQSCIVTCDGVGFKAISGGGGDSDTVDGIHASTTAVANKLLALNGSGVMPCSITGSSASCTGNAATATTATTANSVAAASISQSKLKTANGAVSNSSGGSAINLTLPGGLFGFYPQTRYDSEPGSVQISLAGSNSSYATNICLNPNVGGNAYAQQTYVQASPPYNLGDGEIPLFVFALVNKIGEVLAIYTAPEAPWHNNGPTSIRPDIYAEDGRRFKRVRKELSAELLFENPGLETHRLQEITQAVKQADMGIIPHPFTGNDLNGLTVVLIDPVSDHTWRAAELFGDSHDEHHNLYYQGKLQLDNEVLQRSGPPGVQVCGVRWKNSK